MFKRSWKQKLSTFIAGIILISMLGGSTVFAEVKENSYRRSNIDTSAITTMPLLKSSKAIYYKTSLTPWPGPDTNKLGKLSNIVLKGNKIITQGSFRKSSSFSYGKGTYCKSKKRTFKLTKNVKYYAYSGGKKIKKNRAYVEKYFNIDEDILLGIILNVKNNKVFEVILTTS